VGYISDGRCGRRSAVDLSKNRDIHCGAGGGVFHLECGGRRRPPKPGGDDGRPLPFVWKIQPCVVTIQMTILSVAHNRLPRQTASASGPQTGPPICANKSPEICHRPTGCRPPSKRGWSTPSRTPKKAGSNPARSTPRFGRRNRPLLASRSAAQSISQWATCDDLPMGHHWRPPGPLQPAYERSWILCRPGDPPGRNPPLVLSQKSEKSPIETASVTAH